jgi:hypothetical protein
LEPYDETRAELLNDERAYRVYKLPTAGKVEGGDEPQLEFVCCVPPWVHNGTGRRLIQMLAEAGKLDGPGVYATIPNDATYFAMLHQVDEVLNPTFEVKDPTPGQLPVG